MILLKVYSSRTYYEGPQDQINILLESLRLPDKKSHWKAQFLLKKLGYYRRALTREEEAKREKIIENAKWINFYDKRTNSFGTGLLKRAKNYLRSQQVLYKIQNHRKELPEFREQVKFRFKDKVETRPEQLEVLKIALQKGNGILHCSVNFGKTEVACAITDVYRRTVGKVPRVLYLVHRLGLVKQTQKRFIRHLGLRVKRIGGGRKEPGRITISSTQTASILVQTNNFRFKEFLSKCDIVFVDELHVNKARQVRRVMDRCAARMRFGLSGTISKETPKLMHFESITGPIIAEIRSKELIALGRSAMPIIRLVKFDSDVVTGNYAESYQWGVVHNEGRNERIKEEALRYVDRGFRTLITVGRIHHGRNLQDLDWGDLEPEFIQGSTPLFARDKAKRKFISGKSPILIVSPIFDVGEDLPEIDAWVNAAAGKGWELTLQRIGRTMRRKKGENVVYVTDFMDLHNKYLFKHSMKRASYYRDEGFRVNMVGGNDGTR